mmetsp:Transcript_23483/g.38596  ORF Transcript_23483/g.38596 Transcript_23483/m.38596 type:complete len:325 (+) Transcript_23483:965-1939(+)
MPSFNRTRSFSLIALSILSIASFILLTRSNASLNARISASTDISFTAASNASLSNVSMALEAFSLDLRLEQMRMASSIMGMWLAVLGSSSLPFKSACDSATALTALSMTSALLTLRMARFSSAIAFLRLCSTCSLSFAIGCTSHPSLLARANALLKASGSSPCIASSTRACASACCSALRVLSTVSSPEGATSVPDDMVVGVWRLSFLTCRAASSRVTPSRHCLRAAISLASMPSLISLETRRSTMGALRGAIGQPLETRILKHRTKWRRYWYRDCSCWSSTTGVMISVPSKAKVEVAPWIWGMMAWEGLALPPPRWMALREDR